MNWSLMRGLDKIRTQKKSVVPKDNFALHTIETLKRDYKERVIQNAEGRHLLIQCHDDVPH